MQKLRFAFQMIVVIAAFPVLFITGISYPKVQAKPVTEKNHLLYAKNSDITKVIVSL